MKFAALIPAAVALFAAVPASAVTYTLGAVDSGPVDVSATYKPGYTLIDFEGGTSPFSGGAVENSSASGLYATPAGDTSKYYFSVGPSTSSPATLALSGINQLSFYWGSIDSYNSISFDGLGVSYDGTTFGATGSSAPSREVTFNFTATEAAALKGISLKSTTNAFELDNVAYGSAVPEAGTWVMMIAGFGAIGFAMRRRTAPGAAFAA